MVIHCLPAGSGDLLLDLYQVRRLGLRFDDRFELTEGSDTLSIRLLTHGGVVVFAPAAAAVEKVFALRMTRAWTRRRQFRVGVTSSRTSIELAPPGIRRITSRVVHTAGGTGRVTLRALRNACGMATGSVEHHARGSHNLHRGLGIITDAWGGVYGEYRRLAGGIA